MQQHYNNDTQIIDAASSTEKVNLEILPESDALRFDERKHSLRLKELEVQEREILVTSKENDVEARKKYATCTFILVCSWLGLILLIVCVAGVQSWCPFVISFSDTVIVTLITTTTANILAYFTFVLRYLFPPLQSTVKHHS